MKDISIERTLTPDGGRYAARVKGVEEEAELTFSRPNRAVLPAVIVADHTFAPNSMRGMGVAQALVERLFADARADGAKIRPACSYVRAQFARHPDWADVLAD